jgi:release factor glutamine methyltransferase
MMILDLRKTLAEGTARLRAASIETPALDASLLLSEASGLSREKLSLAVSQPVETQVYKHFCSLIDRRAEGECVAYILGRKEFYGLDFIVSPAVLVPRPDTEILVEAAIEAAEKPAGPLRLLDLCTGSGAVALALKHRFPRLDVVAADISAEALDIAGKNARILLQGTAAGGEIHFLKGDLFAALPAGGPTFNIITANPPYVPAREIAALAREVKREPVLALNGGEDGLDVIRRIITESPSYLAADGRLLLEADPRQMSAISDLMEEQGFVEITVRKDLAGLDRVIGGRIPARDNASAGFKR